MTTDEELLRLAAGNLGRWEPVWVSHYFAFTDSTLAERVAFRDDLLAAGIGQKPERRWG